MTEGSSDATANKTFDHPDEVRRLWQYRHYVEDAFHQRNKGDPGRLRVPAGAVGGIRRRGDRQKQAPRGREARAPWRPRPARRGAGGSFRQPVGR